MSRPFREHLWDPRPGDEHVLHLGLRRLGTMHVVTVEPHRIVTEERCGLIPVVRHFANGEAFARCYGLSADPCAVIYASEAS